MFQRKRIDNRNRQAEAKTLQAHAIQKDFVQAGVMYEQNAARQNLYDPVERDAPIETSTNNSVGQSMHDRTITDVTARTDNKSLGCLQIDPAFPEVDTHLSVEDDENLIRFCVAMPDEVPLQPDQLEMIVVHLSHDLG